MLITGHGCMNPVTVTETLGADFFVVFPLCFYSTLSTPCRVAFRYLEDGSKVRVSRGGAASGSVIPRPEILTQRRTARPTESKS